MFYFLNRFIYFLKQINLTFNVLNIILTLFSNKTQIGRCLYLNFQFQMYIIQILNEISNLQ